MFVIPGFTFAFLSRIAVVLIAVSLPVSAIAQIPVETGDILNITLEAKLIEDDPAIKTGLVWRIFPSQPDENGKLALLATATGGTKTFEMSPGSYFIHVAYGYASAIKRIELSGTQSTQTIILNAGGLQLQALAEPDTPIAANLLRFDVFSKKVDERGVRQLIARDVRPDKISPFSAGTYHVVSHFGKLNAETRADLRVQSGKVTKAILQHRAAKLSFRLVRRKGGDAIADTAWSVLSEAGDIIQESNSTFPTLVLSEGNYTAIARNSGRIYSHDFSVKSGFNREIEVVTEN